MWPAIRCARRRLSDRAAPSPADAPETADITPTSRETTATCDVEDVVIVLGQVEIAQLLVALETALGDAVDRPNTPARLERALSLLMAGRGEPGRPRVLRRPAAVSTPESWEIHLDGIQRATGMAVREAGRSGVIAS
jgi:hypothetical protein